MTATPPPFVVAVLGAGVVGRTLAQAWASAGHTVILGSREPGSLRLIEVAEAIGQVTVARHAEAARAADVVVVTLPGDQVTGLVEQLGDELRDRLVIDATNDITPSAPALNQLAALREAGAVAYRAFNTVGWEQMANPVFGRLRADLPFAGPEQHRSSIERLISDVGFGPVYLGDDQRAVDAVDALARLWFLLAFSRGYGRRLAWKLLTETETETETEDGSA